MTNLYISPKFAQYLHKKGMLEGVLNSYENFTKQQNYAFEVKDRNIARLAIAKALAENPKVDVKEVKRIAKELMTDFREMSPSKETKAL